MLLRSKQYYEHSELVDSLVKPSRTKKGFYLLDLSNEMTTLDCNRLEGCNKILKPAPSLNTLHLVKQFGSLRFVVDTLFSILCRYEQSTNSLFSIQNDIELKAAMEKLVSYETEAPEEVGNQIVNALFKESLGFYKHTVAESNIEKRFVMSFEHNIKPLLVTLLQILCEVKASKRFANIFIIDPDCKLMSEVVTNLMIPVLRRLEMEGCRVTHNHKSYARDAKLWSESVNKHSLNLLD